MDDSPDCVLGMTETLGGAPCVDDSPLLGATLGMSSMDDPGVTVIQLPAATLDVEEKGHDEDDDGMFAFDDMEEASPCGFGSMAASLPAWHHHERIGAVPSGGIMTPYTKQQQEEEEENEDDEMLCMAKSAPPSLMDRHITKLHDAATQLRQTRRWKETFECPRNEDCVTRTGGCATLGLTPPSAPLGRCARDPVALQPWQVAKLGLPAGVSHVCTACYAKEVYAGKYQRPKPRRGRTQALNLD